MSVVIVFYVLTEQKPDWFHLLLEGEDVWSLTFSFSV